MTEHDYLRSRKRRGRWFHYYRRWNPSDAKVIETSLEVHGLEPDDPRVKAAYFAKHAEWEHEPEAAKPAQSGSFRWGIAVYKAGPQWKGLSDGTQQHRNGIFSRYLKSQGDRPISTITKDDIEAALYSKGGHGAVNDFKALRPVFRYLYRTKVIPIDPMKGVEIDRPKIKGHETAGADEIERFQRRWAVGTTERLIFDLALFTGAARVDLAKLSRSNISDDLLIFDRQKTGVRAYVPMTVDLKRVISQTPDISPAFILTDYGKPFTQAGLGNKFQGAAKAAKVSFRLHGLRKAFCCYWAEQGKSATEIASMAGHSSLSEVELYTRAADRKRIVKLIAGSQFLGHT
ncbi:MAG: tyrosine-type recombinase/integrase [Pseudomonadota bacterium]